MAEAATQKIRIRMKAYDYKLLDQSAGEIVDTALLEPASQPLGNTETEVSAKTLVQLAHRCFVEMVVVIVGNQYQVDRRHFRHRQGGWREPSRPDQPERAGTVRQHRVGQYVQTPMLEQE